MPYRYHNPRKTKFELKTLVWLLNLCLSWMKTILNKVRQSLVVVRPKIKNSKTNVNQRMLRQAVNVSWKIPLWIFFFELLNFQQLRSFEIILVRQKWLIFRKNVLTKRVKSSPWISAGTCVEITNFLLVFFTVFAPRAFPGIWSAIFCAISIRGKRRDRIFSYMKESRICYFTVNLHFKIVFFNSLEHVF